MLHKINQIGSYEFFKNYTRHEQNPQGIATTSFPLSSHHLPWLVSLEFLFCCSEHFICEIQESLLQDKLEYIRTSADAIFSTPSTKSAVLVHPFLMPPTSPGGGGGRYFHMKSSGTLIGKFELTKPTWACISKEKTPLITKMTS